MGLNVPLSPKHRRFCEEYLRTWNATDAYQAAYPKASRDTARANGSDLLANTDIAEEIERRLDELTMSADEVLMRLAEQARADYSVYLTPEGTVNLKKMITDGMAHLIKGIKETQFGKQIEFHDAQTALIQIGKHHKLWTEQVQHSGSVEVKVKGYVHISPDDWDESDRNL